MKTLRIYDSYTNLATELVYDETLVEKITSATEVWLKGELLFGAGVFWFKTKNIESIMVYDDDRAFEMNKYRIGLERKEFEYRRSLDVLDQEPWRE